MKFQIKKVTKLILINLFFFILTSSVYSKNKSYVKDGLYIGGFVVNSSMTGDFKGLYYDEVGEITFLPPIDNADGFAFVLGAREKGFSIELGYQNSEHNTKGGIVYPLFIDEGPILFADSKASYNVIDFNIKFDILAQQQIRPYILMGLGYSWLILENNFFDYTDTLWGSEPLGDTFGDSTFGAFNVNLGLGVSYYLLPQIAITTGVISRWNNFTSWDYMINESISERTFSVNVGLLYTF